MYKQYPKITHENETEEVLWLGVILHECHCFLQRWSVLIGDRVEETDNAFVAVTELEKEVRGRRNALAAKLGMDIEPF